MHWKLLLVTLALAALPQSLWAQTAEPTQAGAAKLYHDYCSVCHGDRGDGKSHAARDMVPPPRDFTTPQSSVELTRGRLVASIREGRPGTAMAAWKNQLSDAQIIALADFIRDRFMVPTAYDTTNEGRRVYAEYCSVCHGDRGNGQSRATQSLRPPPRDFTTAKAKQELTRERMIFSTTYGRANTAMAGWETQLEPSQIGAVVDYIRTNFMGLGPQPTATAQSPEPKTAPDPANASANTAAYFAQPFPDGLKGNRDNGLALYLVNCVPCHGIEGDGEGPRAFFILPRPRDFTHPAARASLNRPQLYRSIAKGVLGAEMPAWEKVLTPQQIADISEYMLQTFILPSKSPPAAR